MPLTVYQAVSDSVTNQATRLHCPVAAAAHRGLSRASGISIPVTGSGASAYGASSSRSRGNISSLRSNYGEPGKNGVVLSDAIVHSLLQRDLLRRHDVVVTDDVVDFHLLHQLRALMSMNFCLTSSTRSRAPNTADKCPNNASAKSACPIRAENPSAMNLRTSADEFAISPTMFLRPSVTVTMSSTSRLPYKSEWPRSLNAVSFVAINNGGVITLA